MIIDHQAYYQDPAVAQTYDAERFHDWKGRLFNRLEQRAIRRLLRRLPPGCRVLDAACGTGRITELLLREGFEVVGVDIALPMIRVAQRRTRAYGSHVTFHCADLTRLPFENDSFAAATCIRLFMHLDAPTRVQMLSEIKRVSRQGVVVGYGCPSGLQRARQRLQRHPISVRFPVTPREIGDDLERCGLGELRRSWTLPGLSSSLLLLLAQDRNEGRSASSPANRPHFDPRGAPNRASTAAQNRSVFFTAPVAVVGGR